MFARIRPCWQLGNVATWRLERDGNGTLRGFRAGHAPGRAAKVCLYGVEMHENQVLECIFFKKQQVLE